MTAAAVAFCCVVALALVEGYGAPAFAGIVASEAVWEAFAFLAVLLVARFAARRMPSRAQLVERLYAAGQGLVAGLAFGWWWFEPHAMLTSLTSGSLAAMAWQAVGGAAAGFVLALASERAANPRVMREVGLGAAVLFLAGGGRIYRAFDQVEAGVRITTALAIFAGVAAIAVLAYLALRNRERAATAIPALAPAVACLVLFAAAQRGGAPALSGRESVLLVVVDTLRADIADKGMAGAPPAMPELARIAQGGVRFSQAISPAPWTLPATVSLLSGWNPHRHAYGASASFWEVVTGDPRAMYLAGDLRDAGYLAAAFVHNPYLRPYFGFGAGFYTMRPYHGRAFDGMSLALDWLGDHAGQPSFVMLHLMDPHWPYEAPPGFGEPPVWCASCTSVMAAQYGTPQPWEKEELRRRYTAEVRFTDAMLGRFHDTLAAQGWLERTWLVITADHGEEFWEHGGFLHGHSLHDELLRVPLVIVPPKGRADARRGVRIDEQVRLEDVAATILDITGLDQAKAPDGRSLAPLLEGKNDAAPRVEVAGFVKITDDFTFSVRNPPWKAIVATDAPNNRLYALDRDPGERSNLLIPELPEPKRSEAERQFLSLAGMPGLLGLETSRSTPKSRAAAPDADTARNLRSLGYAQ